MAVTRDILIQFHMHKPVFGQRVHLAGLRLSRLEKAQRLRNRHLVDEDLLLAKRYFRNAVACLDNAGLAGRFCCGDTGGALEEAANGYSVGCVIGALVDNLQTIVRHQAGSRHLNPSGSPAIGHRHFTTGKGNLIARNRKRLEQGAADHPLCLLVKISEVVVLFRVANQQARGAVVRAHSAASLLSFAIMASFRMRRISSSSDWKST